MQECSKGRLQKATVIVVLCVCGAGLATYFALRNKPGLDITYPPEPTRLPRNQTCNNAEAPLIDVSDATNENETLEIRCRGNVGAPAKHIFLEVQLGDAFQTFSAENITNATSKDCDNERETNFTITATLNWNNSMVRCSVRNEDNSVLSSGPRRISIVRPNISFELSKSPVHIGDENVSMTCKISKYAKLRRVDILHKKEETGTIETIATITKNSSYINESKMTLIEGKMNADSAILRTVFASALACQDKGRYYCTASASENLFYNKTLKLDLLRKPRKPTLLLNRDIVEGKQNGIELPFTCEGDVGYPPGRLELGSNSTNYFFPIIEVTNTTISNETCQVNQKITFYYTFSRSWHEKEICCSAINNKSLESDEVAPFDSHIVQVVPADYCQNRPDSSYYHPYKCSYYTDCVNGSVNIKQCPGEQCFGLNKTSGCDICEKSNCVRDVVASVCSKSNASEIVPLLDVRCSMYVNCTNKMVHECPGNKCFNLSSATCAGGPIPPPCTAIDCFVYGATTGQNATIVCPVGDVYLTSVAVTVTPYRSGGWEMFYVNGVSRLGVLQGNKEVTLTLFGARPNQTLSIGLHPLQCRQIGQYITNINNVMCGRITVTDNAEVPNITLPNATHENRTLEIGCRGNVGAPAKHIFLEVQFVSSSFQTFYAENITNATSNDCDNKRETNFTITVTLNWNNSLVRCSVRNEDNSVLSSEPRRINIVRPSVTLQPSKSTMYIGDKDFLMACVVSNYLGLKRVELYHESERLGTRESIANITEGSTPTYKSGISLADAVITPEYAFLRVKFINPITCNDGEKYLCVAIGNVTLNSSMKLIKARRPSKPVLFLSRDIVEGKENLDQLPHTCEGDVGYPAGKLLLWSNFTISFNSTITNVSTTVSDEKCEAYQKIYFKYTFSRSWHGQELRCSVVNDKSLGENETSPFDAKVVKIVSADSCMDRSDGKYYHQYNCSNYIYCVNGTVHIGECQIAACFGLNETDRCNVCAETKCVPDVIGVICSSSNVNELVPYSPIRCSMYANCTDRTIHECPRNECFSVSTKICKRNLTGINCSASSSTIGSNATILCTMGEVKVTSVIVIVTSGRNVELLIFYVKGVNGSGVLSSNASASLTLFGTGSSQTLSIGLHPLQCHHIGLYSINVNNELGGEIRITDNAEVPNITLPNATHENRTLEIRCRGNVGAPAKHIFLEVQFGSSGFQTSSAENVTNVTSNDCDNERETKFTIIATLNWNNTRVRCSVRNEDNSVLSSEARRINLVRPSVTLQPSKSIMYIGDKNFLLTCVVSNYLDLKRVELYHESIRLGTNESVVNITEWSTPTYKSGLSLADAVMSVEYAFLRVNFTNPLTCNDGEKYICVAIGNVTLNSSVKLVRARRPSKPTLFLSRDIVDGKENEDRLPHTCEGDVGYPAGKLLLGSNFTTIFNVTITNVSTTVSDDRCEAYQKITFRYAFSRNWHGQELRCSVIDSLGENETLPFDAKVVKVVPADSCMDRSDRQYYHQFNCSNFIYCVNRTVHIGECQQTACFGLNETDRCNVCAETKCVPGVIGEVCLNSNVVEPVPYSRIRCSVYVNCTDRTMHECPWNECFNVNTKTCPSWTTTTPPPPEICPSWTSTTPPPSVTRINCSASESTIGSNATIRCAVGEVNVTSVSVKVTSSRNVELRMFYVDGVNGSGVLSSNSSASLTLSGTGASRTLSIGLHPLQCHHIGLYSLNVNYKLCGEIRITDNAEVPLIFMTSVANENGTTDIICRGNVGAPAKEIFLEVKFHDSTGFLMFSTINSTNTTLKDCDNERETKFTIITTQNWNNSLVRCSVKNESNNVQSSEEREIIIVPVVTLEPSIGRVYIGDRDFSMTCIVSGHKDLKSVEIYHEPEQLGTRERIAFVTKQNRSAIGGIIISAGSSMTDEHAFLRINFTNVTCADGGKYQCVAIGNFSLTSVLKLDISSEPNDPTLTPSPWIVENKTILRDRMFRCEGMVGKPASQMFVQANISGSFKEYPFPSIPSENNATEAQCNTKQLYQFYDTFNMSWNGSAIRCAVKNARTNENINSSQHILMVINKNYCVGKGDYMSYPHPYECRKFIMCYSSTVWAVYTCGIKQCFGVNQTSTSGCTFCDDSNLQCYPGALK